MVLVAGCAGTDDLGDSQADPDPEGSDPGTGDSPDGESPSGGGDASDDTDTPGGSVAPLEDPERFLTSAGNFEASWSYTLVDGGETETAYEYDVLVDRRSNTSLERSWLSDATDEVVFERYNAAGQSYVKYGSDAEAFYMMTPQESSPFDDAVSDAFVGDIDRYRLVGTETFDGITVNRYELSDTALWTEYGVGSFGDAQDVRVTDFSLVVLVDGDGLARSTSWKLVGETSEGNPITGEWQYTLTGIGSTTVDQPDWVELAMAGDPTDQEF